MINLFKVEETVTLATDLNQGKIQWIVKGQDRHQVTHEILKDNKIVWVPVIFLLPNDCVEIIE